MIIRHALLSDLSQYTELLQVTYQSTYTNPEIGLTAECFSPEIFASADTRSYLKSHLLNSSRQKTWLAIRGEKLVGSITCILQSDQEAELAGFYVHPSFQGGGIGKKLYNQALTFAGDRELVLDTYAHNFKTLNLYKQWGWQVDTNRGEDGYFYRHWPEWPAEVQAKCVYLRLTKQ